MDRNVQLDNAKAWLILLIVIGHIIEPVIWRQIPSLWYIARSTYFFIYLFHLPMIIVISGYVSKADKSFAYFKKNVFTILIPYLIFQFLNQTFNYWFTFDPKIFSRFNPLYPSTYLWYLMSLFCWRVMLPFFIHLKYPIVIATLISLVSGYFMYDYRLLSVSQTLSWCPLFVVGFYLKKNDLLTKILHKIPIILSIVILLFAGACSFFVKYNFVSCIHWLWNADPYSRLGHPEWFASFYRLCILILNFVVGVSFLKLIPKDKLFFTKIGQRTLPVFLFHTLFIKLLVKLELFNHIQNIQHFVALLAIGSIFTFLFYSEKIIKATIPLCEPLKFIQSLKKSRTGS